MKSSIKSVIILGSGTSTGVPSIGCSCLVCKSTNLKDKRLRSSVLIITNEDKKILIDCGPDFRAQALNAGIDKLDAVLFTHTHADHAHGFDDLRQLVFRHKTPIDCYIDEEDAKDLRSRFAYAFQDTGYQGMTPKVEFHYLEKSANICGLNVKVHRLPHGSATTLGFEFEEFLYFTDFKHVPQDVMEVVKTPKHTVVLSAARKILHHSHSSMSESMELCTKFQSTRGILTHLSHDYDHETDSKALPEGIKLAYDGLRLDFNQRTGVS